MAQPDAARVRAYFAAATTDEMLRTNEAPAPLPTPPTPLPTLPSCAILAPVPSALPSHPEPPPENCCICFEPKDCFQDDIVKSKVRQLHRWLRLL